jgi:O-antigen/teichoic acid export membrane protein
MSKFVINGWSRYSFSFVSILGFGITFIQNFIFAAILDKVSFGKIFLISTLFSTFTYLSVFGLDTTIFKYYFDDKFPNKQDLRLTIFFSWLLLATGLFTLLLLVGHIFIYYLEFNLLQFTSEYIPLLASGILFSFFLVFQQFFIASRNLLFYFLTSFGVRAVLLVFNLGAIWIFGSSVKSFVTSYFIATIILFAVAIVGHGFLRRKANAGLVREIFSFSSPLILNGLISISFTNGYRIIVSSLISFADLAVFGIISQIASAYYIGITSLILPRNSEAFQYLQNNANEKKREVPFFKARLLQYGLAGLICLLAISFLLLKYFKSGLYFPGFKMLPLLLVGQFFFLIYAHEHIVLSFWKKTSLITTSTSIGIAVILSTVYILTDWLGLWGVCLASGLGYICQYLAARIFSEQLFKINA